LEILIALLVLSIGLLGVAGLQTRGQQFNTAAYLYTQATYLATDLMERMRSNYDMVERSGSGSDAITQKRQELKEAYSKKIESSDCPAEQECGEDAGCTPLELVEYDLSTWCDSLKALPEGEAEIVSQDFSIILPGTTTPPVLTRYTSYTIILKWWGVNQGKEDAEKKEQRWLMIQ